MLKSLVWMEGTGKRSDDGWIRRKTFAVKARITIGEKEGMMFDRCPYSSVTILFTFCL